MNKVLLTLSGGLATMMIQTPVQAGPLAPMVNQGNTLRAQAWCLNQQARHMEHQVRVQKRQGINPVHMSLQARDLRRQATLLAKQSNRVALLAFNSGYIRPGYSVA